MTSARPTFQFRLRTLFVITTVVAVLLAVYVVWDRVTGMFFEAMLVGETGPVPLRDDWPDPLKELLAELDGIELDQSTIRVHCLCQGFDPEYVWQMDAAPGLFEHIEERWGLTEVTNPNWPVLKGRSHLSGVATPSWWSPKDDENTSFFVCPQTLAGRKGDRFQVALDERKKTIFVRYWFNF